MKNPWKTTMLAIALPAVLYIAGFVFFLKGLPVVPTVSGKNFEGIVIFTGGRGRINAGIDYISNGFGGPVLITGVNQKVSREKLFAEAGIGDMPSDRIFLDYQALTTHDNVLMTAKWAKENQISHVGLVTSYYHLPRSLVLFKRITPQLEVISLPVFHENVPRPYLFKEYSKYLLTFARIY